MYTLFVLLFCIVLSKLLFFKFKVLQKVEDSKINDIKLSVIIPARNEEQNIKTLIESLQKQSFEPFEIIVVNDASSDYTAQIAADFGAKVINNNSTPNGWTGKNYACYFGAKKATGDVLLFLDADVLLKENALKRLVGTYLKNIAVVSVQPFHYTKKIYEQASLFFNLIAVAATGILLPGKDKSIGLFGPVILINKDLYFEFGGHTIVKDEVLEDFYLGNKLRKMGISCDMYLGFDEISYRMYKGGFFDLFWGWSKNFSSGALKTPILLLFIIIMWLSTFYSVATELLKSLIAFENLYVIVFYLIVALIVYFLSRKIGKFSILTCILYIFPLTVFTIIFLFSFVLKFIIRKVKWKGRWHKI